MKVKDLNGENHVWNLSKHENVHRANASKLHLKALSFLRVIYPAAKILEEVHLPGINLYLDIYIPNFRLGIECQGDQHYEYVPFFHNRNKKKFQHAQSNDDLKKRWCMLNNIRLIYFHPEETEEQWKAKL